MRLKWIFLVAFGLTTFALTSCVETLDNRKKAGVPWGKDTIEGRYEFTPAQLWTAAEDVLKHQGTLISKDTLKNVLEASVDERTILVKIAEFDTKISRVFVQARTKGGVADLEMAAFIDKQIAVRLASGNLTPAAPPRR